MAQTYKNYIVVMNLVGGCFTVSSTIMIMMPFVLKLRRISRKRKAMKLARNSATNSQDSSIDSDQPPSLRAGSAVDFRKKKSILKQRDPSATVVKFSEGQHVARASKI